MGAGELRQRRLQYTAPPRNWNTISTTSNIAVSSRISGSSSEHWVRSCASRECRAVTGVVLTQQDDNRAPARKHPTMKIKRILGLSLTLLGSILSLVALGASVLGIEQEGGWGPARSFLLASGIVLIVLPHLRRGVTRLGKLEYPGSNFRHLLQVCRFTSRKFIAHPHQSRISSPRQDEYKPI